MARTKGRVVLSKNPKENLDLAQKIYEKHVSLGDESPLNILDDIDWSVSGKQIAPALESQKAAEFHKGEMEKYYVERDKALPEIVKAVKQSIALLKAKFGDNPKKLTDWGVSIDDTPQVKKSATKKKEE